MKRAITTLGVVGLALFSVAVPASAENDKQAEKLVSICHDGKLLSLNLNGVGGPNGHSGHPEDIIEPNDVLPGGLNWVAADGFKNCGVVIPPVVVVDPPVVVVDPPVVVVDPPVVVVVDPPTAVVDPPTAVVDPPAAVEQAVVEPPVVEPQTVTAQTPVTVSPAPQAAAPKPAAKTAAKVPAAAASAVRGTNQGYNAQTTVGGAEDSSTWMAGMGLLLGAGAVVAVRRRARTESPTAG
ncbi:hypothetical protein ACS5PJ_07790 [Pseudarthrobacter sp. YS3]|uniref:hypothetical protein n=1 Tax=Pseudarthrobacter sp. YS3 TaxID=3453718 RepID=UPI003EE9AFBC